MKKKYFTFLKWLLPVGLGALLIYIPYTSFTPEERLQIFESIKDADYFYVWISLILAFLSHLSRAWRWNYMLAEVGNKPSFLTNVMAIGAGYAINLIIPRGGELARAGVVRKSNGIPIEKAMGTIIAERVLDLVVLLGITTTALLIASNELISMFKSSFSSIFNKNSWIYISVFVLGIVGLIFLTSYLLKKTTFYKKLKQFVIGLKEGFATIWTMEKKLLYLLHTIFIWAMYLAMFYVCFYSVPEFQGIAIAPVMSAFVAGSFSVAFINGGFGAYPYLIAQVLSFYGYVETLGTSIGWILWLSQTVLVIVYGAISLLLISSNNRLFSK